MQNSFIEINSIKIAYYEINRDAQDTIFFIHGNSVSKSCWRKQLESDLLKNYRLVSFDLPGHGDSDKAEIYNEVYTLKGFAAIATEIIKILQNNKRYILAGLSLGTNILTEMLAHNLQPSGIVLAGPCVVSLTITADKIVKQNTHLNVVFTEDADINDVRQYAKETSLSNTEEDFQFFIHDYIATDKKVRSVIATSISAKDYSDEIELLKKSNILTMVVFGEDEKVVNIHYLDEAPINLWNNTIYKIPGASHLVNIDTAESFNKLLAEFAKDIFTKGDA